MISLQRRVILGVLTLIGIAGLASSGQVRAQDKKEEDVLKTMTTSDGLELGVLWFAAKDKPKADTVLMFPKPGGVLNKQWIGLAEALQAKGFAVLAVDWRGAGMNGPAPKPKDPPADPPYLKGRGKRIIPEPTKFFAEVFNKANTFPKSVQDTGLNFKNFTDRQKDAIYNDLFAARFFLDKKNDTNECNTNRIWIITEKEGYQVALGFLGYEAHRNSIYPEQNALAKVQSERAIKNYCGIIAFSPTENNAAGTELVRKYIKNSGNADGKAAIEHIERRLAIIAIHGKSETDAGALRVINRWTTGTKDQLKEKFKYTLEFDNSKVKGTPTGIDLIDATDSLGAQKGVVDFLKAVVSVAVTFGDTQTTRNVGPIQDIPRCPIMTNR